MTAPVSRRRDARLIALQVLILALVGTLFARLAWVQLGGGGNYKAAAADNSVRETIFPAQRGLILDQLGRPLVGNRASIAVTVDRVALARQKDGGKAIIEQLAAKLGTTPEAIELRMKSCGTEGAPKQPLCWNGPNQQPVIVADDIPRELGLQLLEQQGQLPAVKTVMEPKRSYPHPYGVNMAQVAGYLGPITQEEYDNLPDDEVSPINAVRGRSGLEAQYEEALAGKAGVERIAMSRTGQAMATLMHVEAEPGKNVITSIDAKLQALVEQQLNEAINAARNQGGAGDSGTIIVMDNTNGRILAMASYPTYDPQIWVGGISEKNYKALMDEKAGVPMLNRAIQGQYPPASTFKVISTAAAMKAGISGSQAIPCNANYYVGNQAFGNYESHAYGAINLAKALEVSCDTVFYGLAHDMWLKDGGIDPSGTPNEYMVNMAKEFGLGKKTGIDLPGEEDGRIVSRKTKESDFAELKDAYCKRATEGYPEVKDPARADLLKLYARDFCESGYQYRAGDALNFAIGQGDTAVTPLQMAVAYSAIANGGTLYKPEVARAIVNRNGSDPQRIEPEVTGHLNVPESTLSYIRDALANTSKTGTAAGVFAGFPLDKISVAAKTGTGEVTGKKPTVWFASFAPVNNPRFTVLCTVSQGKTGAETCGPSVRKIYEGLFGVTGTDVSVANSVLKGGQPSSALPKAGSDGFGQTVPGGNPLPTSIATPTATPTQTPSAPPTPTPSQGGESAGKIVPPAHQPAPSESVVGIVPRLSARQRGSP